MALTAVLLTLFIFPVVVSAYDPISGQLRPLLSRALRKSTSLLAVRRRPTRVREWEVQGEGEKERRQYRKEEAASKEKGKQETEVGEINEDEQADIDASSSMVQGLVLERYGDRLLVELDRFKSPIVCSQRSTNKETTIVVGDRVNLALQSGSSNSSTGTNLEFEGVVWSHAPRKTLLQRPLPAGKGLQMKAIAANVDQVVLVVCATPKVPPSSIDRILIAARAYGIDSALLVLNKCDDIEGTQALRQELSHYPPLGYDILEVSVERGEGLDALRERLRDRVSVLVGQSGVGKSSLVNALLPDAAVLQRVGALVRNANIGAHTTSSARLFHLPDGADGGSLIDSPGIRELGVWHLSVEDIHEGFFEIAECATRCKFKNCAHTRGSLGCAVLGAVDEGSISSRRFEHWREMSAQ